MWGLSECPAGGVWPGTPIGVLMLDAAAQRAGCRKPNLPTTDVQLLRLQLCPQSIARVPPLTTSVLGQKQGVVAHLRVSHLLRKRLLPIHDGCLQEVGQGGLAAGDGLLHLCCVVPVHLQLPEDRVPARP